MDEQLWQEEPVAPDLQPVVLNLVDPEGWWEARVKWDGCIDLQHYYNFPRDAQQSDDDSDNLHICDLDDFIDRLVALRDQARERFGASEEAWAK